MRRAVINPADFGQMGFDFSSPRSPIPTLPARPPMLATGSAGTLLPSNFLLQGSVPPNQLPAVRNLPVVSTSGSVGRVGRVPPMVGDIPKFGPEPKLGKGGGWLTLAALGGEALYDDMKKAEADPAHLALRAQQARNSGAGEFSMYGDNVDWSTSGDYMLSPPSASVSTPPVAETAPVASIEPTTMDAMVGFTPTATGQGLDYTPANFAPLDVPTFNHAESSYVAPTWADKIPPMAQSMSSGFVPSQFSGVEPLPATNFAPMNVPQVNIPARSTANRQNQATPRQGAYNGAYQGGLPPHVRNGSAYTVTPSVTTSVTGVPGQTQVNLNQGHLRINDPEYQRLYALQEARAREALAKQGVSYEQALAHAGAGTRY